MLPRLPYELHEHIVGSISASIPGGVNTWRDTLVSYALTCKDFKHITYPHLFRSIVFIFDGHIGKLPPPHERSRRWLYRYVKTGEDIVSLFSSGRDDITSSVRRLSLLMEHSDVQESPAYLSYHTLDDIIRPLRNLQHLSLVGLLLDKKDPVDAPVIPILPSLPELVIDYQLEQHQATLSQRSAFCISPAELYAVLALFGEIKHLVFNFIALHDYDIVHGSTGSPVHACTVVMHCDTHTYYVRDPLPPLEFVPMQDLRALHLTSIQAGSTIGSSNVDPLSRCLVRIGPVLEHLTVGRIRLGVNGRLFDNNFPNNFLTIDFKPCVRLHTVGIVIQAPRVDEYTVVDEVELNDMVGILDSGDMMRIIQRVVFQPLPPSIKILKMTLLGMLVRKPPLQQSAAARFWEILEASLHALVNKGVERVEIITLKGSSGATPCTESEQEYLKACFPRLVQRDAIFFPEDTFSHHSGRSIVDLLTCG